MALAGSASTVARTPGAPQDAEARDDDFTVESGSVGFDEAPGDTTAGAEAEQAAAVAAAAAAKPTKGVEPVTGAPLVEDGEVEGEPAVGATDEESASGATAGRKKNKVPVAAREKSLAAGINAKTHELRRTESQLARASKTLSDLDAQIKARQQQLANHEGAAAPVAAKPAAEKPAAIVRPTHPNYRDFDSDEAYDKAVIDWNAAIGAYEQQLLAGVKADLTATVDSRLTDAQKRDAAKATVMAFASRVEAAKAKHQDDWDERADNLDGLRSAWHDPKIHGDVDTPFLSDLAAHHIEDGAEFMYWLGEDVDRAQILADLEPSMALRNGLLALPSLIPVMTHFATAEGLKEWDRLAVMHPDKAIVAVGALHAHLTADSRGPAATVRPITNATPPISHRAGVAGAPGSKKETPAAAAKTPPGNFGSWMDEEDAADAARRRQSLGLSAPA